MAESTIKDFNELPVALSVTDVKNVLGISRGSAYNLIKMSGFPAIRVGERRFVIPRDKFIEWFFKEAEKS